MSNHLDGLIASAKKINPNEDSLTELIGVYLPSSTISVNAFASFHSNITERLEQLGSLILRKSNENFTETETSLELDHVNNPKSRTVGNTSKSGEPVKFGFSFGRFIGGVLIAIFFVAAWVIPSFQSMLAKESENYIAPFNVGFELGMFIILLFGIAGTLFGFYLMIIAFFGEDKEDTSTDDSEDRNFTKSEDRKLTKEEWKAELRQTRLEHKKDSIRNDKEGK